MLDSNKLNNASIGGRIECQGYYGTIKYVGEVIGHPGYWLGIDWDDPDRGKHNGTVDGRTYFNARTESSGSFVRPEKVQLGQSIITAITSRYGQKDDEISAKCNQQQLLSIQHTMNAPLLEMIGFDKITDMQSNYQDLTVIIVRLTNVNSAGEPGELKELCPNITELDMSKNLINSWSTVFQIFDELENLSLIDVSHNLLTFPGTIEGLSFPSLTTFICGSMSLTWQDVVRICGLFPNLEKLIAPNNRIENLDLRDDAFRNLRVLDLERNPIGRWSEVCKLGRLPNLETLLLEATGLSEIRFEGAEEETGLFENLRTLFIKDNLIKDWESIGELNKLRNFNNLKFMKNPIFENEQVATRDQFTIARIAKLEVLNGTDIKLERKGAEYDYLRKYGLEWLAAKDDEEKREKFLRSHNRYLELISMHGESEESELKEQVKTILVSLIEIKLVHEDRVIVKKLPPSILVQKLIMLVQRLFGLTDRPVLIYISNEHPDIEIDLDDECKELGIYSVQNGDRIVVKT